MKLGEIKLVATVGGAVPPMGQSHHLPHLLLLLAEGQVGQELSLRLLPGQGAGRAGRTVGHAEPLPLLDEGVLLFIVLELHWEGFARSLRSRLVYTNASN